MNHKKSVVLWAAGLLLAAGTASANVIFTENFDSLANSVALDSSTNWTRVTGASFTGNGSGGLKTPAGGGAITVVEPTTISYTAGESFTMSYDIKLGNGNTDGLIFGYQDTNNYYWLTIGKNASTTDAIVFAGKKGGNAFTVDNHTSAGLVWGDTYRLNLSYTASNTTFDVSVTDLTASSSIYSTSKVDSRLTSGGFGLYVNYSSADIGDNYTVSVIPEPATAGLAGVAAIGVLLLRRLLKS